jgi:hypothetical protein
MGKFGDYAVDGSIDGTEIPVFKDGAATKRSTLQDIIDALVLANGIGYEQAGSGATASNIQARLRKAVFADDYDSLEECIDANATATIIIRNTQTLTGNKTTSATQELCFWPGGKIAGAYTLTVVGSIQAGLFQIFDSTLTVDLTDAKIGPVFPQWWGAVGDTGTEDGPEFTLAVQSGRDVYIADTGATYKVSEMLVQNTSRQKVYGPGEIDFYGDATEYALFNVHDFNVFENFKVNIKNNDTSAFDSPNGISHSKWYRIQIKGTGYGNGQKGIWIRGAEKDAGTANNNQYDNTIFDCDFGRDAAANGLEYGVFLDGVAASGKRVNGNRILLNRFTNFDIGISIVGDGNPIFGNIFNLPRGGDAGGKYLKILAEQTHSEALITGNYFDGSAGYADGIDILDGTKARNIILLGNVLAYNTVNDLTAEEYQFAWLNAYEFRVQNIRLPINGTLHVPGYGLLDSDLTTRRICPENNGDYMVILGGGTNLNNGSAVVVSNTAYDGSGNASKAVEAGGGVGMIVPSGKSVKLSEHLGGDDFNNFFSADSTELSVTTDRAYMAKKGIVTGEWDFAVDGGGIGTYTFNTIPDNATITQAWYEVLTIPDCTLGNARIAMSTGEVANELLIPTDYDAAAFSAGYHDTLADGAAINFTTKTTTSRAVFLVISIEALTQGKIRFWGKYVESE